MSFENFKTEDSRVALSMDLRNEKKGKTTIWKFPIETAGIQEVEMPIGSHILCVQVQFGSPYIWAIVNPNAGKIKRKFAVVGTGHSTNELTNFIYVGTYQLMQGSLVFHFFELF